MPKETVALASDHAGLDLKETLKKELTEMGYPVLDLGTNSSESVDYPDYGKKLGEAVAAGKASKGVAVCGSGIGISIAANKVHGIRAALIHDLTGARLSRLHNNANVIAFGARTTGVDVAKEALKVFLATEFEGGRHTRRVEKLG